MKKLYLITAFCLINLFLSAQEWNVNYLGDHPEGYVHFQDGFIDEDGVTFLAGQDGSDRNTPEALFMRIEPDGSHTEFKYCKAGFYSRATCIIEMPDHNLFVAGNLYGESDDYLMILVLNKQFDILHERQYEKGVDCICFNDCRATLDSHDNVIVSASLEHDNGYQGTDHRGMLFKFNPLGELIRCRYLMEDYPGPLYYFMDFQMRQMWYNEDEETLLCLVPGFGNYLSFITFDSAFNYIQEFPIWQDSIEKSDHTLFSRDTYTDYWYNEDEALYFSSRGDAEHNKLRVSRVNTRGEILDFIRLNERTDTIDDAARPRCMAAANDSTFYFSFYYHTWSCYPGIACVYQLNDRLEIVGRYVDPQHNNYRSCLILPTADGGCVTVNDSCNYNAVISKAHPVIKKLRMEDFEMIPMSINQAKPERQSGKAYPNPCGETLHIPIDIKDNLNARCRVYDQFGRTIIDRKVPRQCMLDLDTSRLKAGIYYYRIYADEETLLTEKFIKE